MAGMAATDTGTDMGTDTGGVTGVTITEDGGGGDDARARMRTRRCPNPDSRRRTTCLAAPAGARGSRLVGSQNNDDIRWQ